MMWRKGSLLAIGIFAVGAAVTLAVPGGSPGGQAAGTLSSGPTVGDFVLKYAGALGLAGQNSKAEEARGALRKAGIIGSEPLDLNAPLTEGDVVRLSSSQLRVTTESPERLFTHKKVAEFFDVFGSDLKQFARRGSQASASSSSGSMPVPSGDDVFAIKDVPGNGGKGKGKGKGQSPHEP
jgi:hypothetical protein